MMSPIQIKIALAGATPPSNMLDAMRWKALRKKYSLLIFDVFFFSSVDDNIINEN